MTPSGTETPQVGQDITVGELMRRWFERLDRSTSVLEAARLMIVTGQQALPVVDGDRLVGMIAEGDILVRLLSEVSKDVYTGIGNVDRDVVGCYRNICGLRVDALMSRRVVTVAGSLPVLRAVGLMRAKHIQRLPVTEGNELVGLLFQTDVHAALLGGSMLPMAR
jgi:CBS domain-containing protein